MNYIRRQRYNKKMIQCKTLTFFLYFVNLSFVTYSAAAARGLSFAHHSLIVRSSFAHRSFALASTPNLLIHKLFVPLRKIQNIMCYTITINSNSTQAQNLVNYIKTFDFAEVTSTFSEEVLEASKVLKVTPSEIVAAAEEYKMSPDDYAWTMMISKKINRNIAKRVCKDFDIPYKG